MYFGSVILCDSIDGHGYGAATCPCVVLTQAQGTVEQFLFGGQEKKQKQQVLENFALSEAEGGEEPYFHTSISALMF